MLFRKMLRTVIRYKAQFFSMIIMIAIGTGMFLGFNMEWLSLEKDTKAFFKETNFADYRITSKDSFSKKDADKISSITGVDRTARYISVNADVKGTENMVGLTVTENPNVSGFVVTDGEAYDENSKDGIWLSDKYAENNNVHTGDEMTLTYDKLTVTGKVKGLIKSGEYMICVRDESQLMPDFKLYGYAYITPKALQQSIDNMAKDEAEKNIRTDIPKTMRDDIVKETTQKIADETYQNVWHQINVISSLSKAEFTEQVEKVLDRTLLILTKDENISYSESQGEVNEGKTMGSVLPTLFLLIAVLTMVSTMHRLVANEKTQIGTLKALGFKDRRILWHYTTFALSIGIFGSVLGAVLGYFVAWFIMNPDGMMGTYIVMTDWTIQFEWWCWAVLTGIVLFLTFIGFLSTRKMLQGTASDVLKPYTPKNIRQLAIEKLSFVNHLSFGTKWNLRDILRHKSRSFMTLFGVMGCTLLIVAGLGMNDTVGKFMDMYYTDIANYSSKVQISDDAENKDALNIAEKYNGDCLASVSVQYEDNPISLDIYKMKYDTVHFLNENNDRILLPDDGALVCMRLKDEYHLNIGDEIELSPYGTSEKYIVKIKGFNRSLSKSISVSEEYAQTLRSTLKVLTYTSVYKINTVFTKTEKSKINDSFISSVQSKEDIMKSMDSFMEIMNLFVVILIISAVILGIIVLYNLGIMSFTERYREMATLKVIGFNDRKIGNLLISQNIWLSVLGILIGIPTAYGTLALLIKMLAGEYEMSCYISLLSLLISTVLTLSVSLAVGLIIARKSRKIDMVSALKIPE